MTNKDKFAFDFIDIDMRPGKPRNTGLTIVRDRMRSLGEQQDFLETYAPFVDFVKLSNMAPRLYSESFLKQKLKLYQSHNVTPFFGGIMFENALAQGKVDAFFRYLSELGSPAIELSDNIIDLEEDKLLSAIAKATSQGLIVFVEWGEKYTDKVFDPEVAAQQIKRRLEAGAAYVIFERAELDQIFGAPDYPAGLTLLEKLAQAVGPQNLIFEAESQEQLVGLLRHFGRDLNLGPNIDFELVKWLEPSRLGISREMGHTTIESAVGRGSVRSRLD